MPVIYEPLAIFKSSHQTTYEAPRQGVLAEGATGWFELDKNYGAESIEDLVGFERVWLVYDFHKNSSWKVKVRPPRFSEKKRSVFATRSPYRPNSIGLSCVKLEKIQGRKIFVSGHDILEGSLILDIKPYIPYADSFPNAATGWLKKEVGLKVLFQEDILNKLEWLKNKTQIDFKQIIENQLSYEPTNSKSKRVKKKNKGFVFSIRTWRFEFVLIDDVVSVISVYSGYKSLDMFAEEDPYKDKNIHRAFELQFN